MSTVIGDGTVVAIHYTLTNDVGEVLDSSSGHAPLTYLHGAGNIVPGLEAALAGLEAGATVRADVPPELGYGLRDGPEPQPFPRSQFPPGQLEAGMRFFARGPDGEAFPVYVARADDQHVWIDFHHPLAGVTLHFDVEIVEVRTATAEEIEHGHPHGPDGHGHDHHH